MVVWFFDSLVAGFRYPTDEARIQWFRIIFGLVCTCRFALAFGHGGWNRFAPDTHPGGMVGKKFSAFALERRIGESRFRTFARIYKPVLVARLVAPIALTVGILPHLSVLLVIAGLAFELIYVSSPNSIRYAILMAACLLVAGSLGSGLTARHHESTANDWAQCLAVLITTDVYWNSAWHKSRSHQFRSGRFLAQWVYVYTRTRHQLRYREHYVPGFVRNHLGTPSPRNLAVWRVISASAIGLEILLPVALIVPQTRMYAIVAGIGMHLCFTCLKPRQLITFTSLAVGSYLLFAA